MRAYACTVRTQAHMHACHTLALMPIVRLNPARYAVRRTPYAFGLQNLRDALGEGAAVPLPVDQPHRQHELAFI